MSSRDKAERAVRVAILVVSDSADRGEKSDLSGPLLARLVLAQGMEVLAVDILPDHADRIATWLQAHAPLADVLLTCGGTGLGPRDVTVEATLRVIQRQVPGIAEAIRAAGLLHTPHAMLSRAVAGVVDATLVVNLSGSPSAVEQQFAVLAPVLGHAVELLHGHTDHPDDGRDGATDAD